MALRAQFSRARTQWRGQAASSISGWGAGWEGAVGGAMKREPTSSNITVTAPTMKTIVSIQKRDIRMQRL